MVNKSAICNYFKDNMLCLSNDYVHKLSTADLELCIISEIDIELPLKDNLRCPHFS